MTLKTICADPAFWIAVTALSEIIGMSKLKDNSIIQVIFNALMMLRPKAQK